MDVNARDTLKLAKTESLLWTEAHALLMQKNVQTRSVNEATLPAITSRWCFTDDHGSWKAHENYSGQGWYIGRF